MSGNKSVDMDDSLKELKHFRNRLSTQIKKRISPNTIKSILALLNLLIVFSAGFFVGESITQTKCNKFIISEYLENPILKPCLGVQQINDRYNINTSRIEGFTQTNDNWNTTT